MRGDFGVALVAHISVAHELIHTEPAAFRALYVVASDHSCSAI